jgi:predicted AlkP superfamily phosphohydrolase/phosphomutase
MPKRAVAAVPLLAAAVLAASCTRAPGIDRVVLLGFDGVGWNVAEPLLAEGRLPALRRLRSEGAWGALRTFQPTKSNILWTSIATGRSMLEHGIVDWTFVDREGLEVPYEDAGRRVKTYWEILDEAGIPTATLNWWVTYPPSPLRHGIVVSSAFKRRSEPGTVHPVELFAPLDALRVPYPEGVAEVRRREAIPEWREEDATSPMGGTRQILRSYPDYLAQDASVDRASDWLWENRPVRVFSTYFRLPDITSHFATHFLDREIHSQAREREGSAGLGPDDLRRLDADFARVVWPAYAFMDRVIAKYLERIDERTLLIVCSDHGFRYFRGRYNHAMPDMEPPDGVVLVHGPGVRRGARLEGASVYDIAPTILWALGQPVAEDMDGRPLGAFDAAWLEAHPVRRIASYETGDRPQARATPDRGLDEQVLQDLRTLGYIGGTEGPEPPP